MNCGSAFWIFNRGQEVRMNLVVIALLVMLMPSVCGSGEHSGTVRPFTVVESRAGQVINRHRSVMSRRLEKFALKNGADAARASEIAELLGKMRYGTVLAAIAAHESRFDCGAIGKAGELGAYQIRPEFWGNPGNSFRSQTEKAVSILEQLLASSGGNLRVALERYNGTGDVSKKYASRVLQLATSI